MPTTTTATPDSDTDYREMTKAELYELARQRDLDGRSTMSKDELVASLIVLDDHGKDAIELVLDQHARIRELFEQIEACDDGPSHRKERLVAELVVVLVKHARMEELALYPVVRDQLPELADELDEGIEEHHLADLMLTEIEGMSSSDDRYDMKVHVLREAIEHHLDEEEQDLLVKVQRGLDGATRMRLVDAMTKAWQVAPTRPHPQAPQTPPGNVVAVVRRTPVDLVRAGIAWLRGRH